MKKYGCITSIIGCLICLIGLDQLLKGVAHGVEEAMSIFGPLFTRQYSYAGAFNRGLVLIPLGIVAIIVGIIIFVSRRK